MTPQGKHGHKPKLHHSQTPEARKAQSVRMGKLWAKKKKKHKLVAAMAAGGTKVWGVESRIQVEGLPIASEAEMARALEAATTYRAGIAQVPIGLGRLQDVNCNRRAFALLRAAEIIMGTYAGDPQNTTVANLIRDALKILEGPAAVAGAT